MRPSSAADPDLSQRVKGGRRRDRRPVRTDRLGDRGAMELRRHRRDATWLGPSRTGRLRLDLIAHGVSHRPTGGPDERHHPAQERSRQVKKLLTELESTTERGVKTRTELFADDQGRADGPRDHRGGDLLPGAEGPPQGEGHRPRGLRGAPRGRSAHGRARGARVDDETWGAKAIVMKENVEHHMEEEEGDMFKKARQVFDRRGARRPRRRGWRPGRRPPARR